jgi:hypothetical protein
MAMSPIYLFIAVAVSIYMKNSDFGRFVLYHISTSRPGRLIEKCLSRCINNIKAVASLYANQIWTGATHFLSSLFIRYAQPFFTKLNQAWNLFMELPQRTVNMILGPEK